ncbi:MAG: hypothetical protein F9K38_00950 [Pseudorhodoplanes sp.]|nr:MAG: hypothetical protein F9K38_00950 [Pseudorhodoplanes sp.]
MTVLEERGVFWWHDDEIPENCFAPPSSVPGLLKIGKDGNITLDLDGYLPSDKGAWSVLMEAADCEGKIICGLLRVTDRRVMLLKLTPQGGRVSTNGLSYSGYHASQCLVSERALHEQSDDFSFYALEIDLTGFEGWLRLGSSEVSVVGSTISVKHEEINAIEYEIGEAKMAIKFSVSGDGLSDGRKDHVEIRDNASIIFYPETPLGLDEMQNKFLWLDDIFTILTDSSYNLTWPRLRHRGSRETRYRWFFMRSLSKESAPEYYKMPTNFIQLRDVFGSIVAAWLEKREEFGAGFYLYLGTRRGMQIYSEHLFASLVWGIEALHRKKSSEDVEAIKIKEKVARVLESVDRRDKRWLCGQLKHAHEPSLEKRIFDVLASLPVEGIDRDAVRAFAKKCAALRNDISHFGSHRNGGSYDEFLRELRSHSEALSKFYHVLILHEIGIEPKIINDWLFRGFKSHYTCSVFVEVGLLKTGILKAATP